MESVVEGYREGKGAEKPTSEHTAAGVNWTVCPSGTETPDELTPVN